jgi:branched-chain amino acid transport system substrate-binding protein
MRRQAAIVGTVLLALGLSTSESPGQAPTIESPGQAPTIKSPGQAPTIKIGVINSVTGKFAPFAESVNQGIQLAISELNERPGIGGRRIELVTEDDQSDAQAAVRAFEKLAKVDKVAGIIGPISSVATRATAPLAEKFGIAQITPTAHDSDLIGIGKNTFVVFPTTEMVGRQAARLAAGRFLAKKVAVINPANSWGEASTKAIAETLSGLQVQLIATEPFKEGTTDFTDQFRRIRAEAPNVLIYPGYYDKESVAITRAAAAEDDIIIIIVGMACAELLRSPEFTDGRLRGRAFVLSETGGQDIPGDSLNANFRRSFTSRFGRVPNPNAAAALASVTTLANALRSTEGDATKVASTLRVQRLETVFGTVTFNDRGANTGANIDLFQPTARADLEIVR